MKRPPQSKPERGYHHGELREALLAAAETALKADGLEQLSLRDAARRAGVSTAAPYHHFAGKDELVAALATRGFERLEASLTRAQTAAGRSTVKRLDAVCDAYLAFATSHAALYEVMFSTVLSRARGPLLKTALRPFAILASAVQARTRRDAPLDALVLWSLGHGLAHLSNAGLIGRNPARLAAKHLVELLSR